MNAHMVKTMQPAVDAIDAVLARRIADGGRSEDVAEEIHGLIEHNRSWWPYRGRRGALELVAYLGRGIAMMQAEHRENVWWRHGHAALAVLDAVRERIEAGVAVRPAASPPQPFSTLQQWSVEQAGALPTDACGPGQVGVLTRGPQAEPLAPMLPGTTAPRLVIQDQVGSGTVGTVHRALGIGRFHLAARVLARGRTPARRVRDETWMSLLRRIPRHPNLAPVLDADLTSDGRPFITTSWLAGTSMAERLAADGRLDPAVVTPMLVDVASGLHALHAAGFAHGMIAPHNILHDAYDRPVLADAGSLLLGGIGPRDWRDRHSAPELRGGHDRSVRTDVYSLAATAATLLGGRVRRGRVTLPDTVPPALADVLRRACAEDPTRRYASMMDLIGAVRLVQAQLGHPFMDVRAGQQATHAPPLPPLPAGPVRA